MSNWKWNITLVFPPDNSYGTKNENGTFGGILGLLQNEVFERYKLKAVSFKCTLRRGVGH